MEQKPSVIATVINDVIYDQRMIRICTTLSADYKVSLWGRKKSKEKVIDRPFSQKRFKFIVNNGPLFYFFYNLRIFVHLMFTRFDIVHSVDLDTLPAGYWACRLKGKKLVYDSHEFFTEVPELINRPRKRKLWLKIEKSILPKVKNAMTVGGMIADAYREMYNVPFAVVRNCPLRTENPTPEKTEKYLLYQGALNKGRGLEALLEAMMSLSIVLKIAGSGDLDDELKLLVDKYNISDKVQFLGMLKPEELPPLTVNAFAGINVSENLGLSYLYSLSNKFFDYIHAGIPAITNPFPEYKLLNEKYQCSVFATAESEEIVKAVNLLLNDTELYEKLRKNCVLAQEELNWEKEEKKVLEVYANIS